jgi:hypothetical protein
MGLWTDASLTTGISGWNYVVLVGETLIYDLASSETYQYLSGLTSGDCPAPTTTTTTTVSSCVEYNLFAAESSSIEWFNCEGVFSSLTFTGSTSICTDGSGYTTTIGSVETTSTGPC